MRASHLIAHKVSRPNRLKLDDVTLVAITSIALEATVRALTHSISGLEFGRVLLLSDRAPLYRDPEIEWQKIDPIRSRADYSFFMLRHLADYVTTTHLLCVQWDGYVVNPSAWNPSFLEHDFIGAPWPHFSGDWTVGNGGFSLRSRRLAEACKDIPFDRHRAEDVLICRLYRAEFERRGMRFAPEAVAHRFSYERCPPKGDEFGFHGVFNLVQHIHADEMLDVIRSLEPGVIDRREHLELLRWALRRGYGKLAFAILSRLRQARRRISPSGEAIHELEA